MCYAKYILKTEIISFDGDRLLGVAHKLFSRISWNFVNFSKKKLAIDSDKILKDYASKILKWRLLE